MAHLPPHEIHHTNLVSRLYVGVPLDVAALARQSPEIFEYNLMSGIVRFASPCATCLFFSTGRAVIVRTTHESDSLLAAWKFVLLLRRCGYPTAQVLHFTYCNATSTVYTGQHMDLFHIKERGDDEGWKMKFKQQQFPGLRWKLFPDKDSRVTIIVFTSGVANIAGCDLASTLRVYEYALPVLMDAAVREPEDVRALEDRCVAVRHVGQRDPKHRARPAAAKRSRLLHSSYATRGSPDTDVTDPASSSSSAGGDGTQHAP